MDDILLEPCDVIIQLCSGPN